MTRSQLRPHFLRTACFGLALAFATQVHAAGSGMPWEEPLQQVLESVQGPVAKIVAVIIIIVTGLTLAFGETAGGFRRAGTNRSSGRSPNRSGLAHATMPPPTSRCATASP